MLLPEPAVLGYLKYYTLLFTVCQGVFEIFLKVFLLLVKRISATALILYL